MDDGSVVQDTDAEIVLSFLGTPPTDLDAICRALRVPVAFQHMDGIAGKLERDHSAPRGFRIVVNSRDPETRQRFTHAHEIAHFVLHRDLVPQGIVDNALYRSNLSDEYERQADRYAAGILLPASAVREAFRTTKSYPALANLFRVSDAALRIRLKELRLQP